jgi:APA family basic amino acid/polyamine antiporter
MPELKQKLTLFDMTMIAIGSTIGSGIFLTPSSIMRALPSPKWALLVWVAGGLMALSGALTFAELGTKMPGAGGVYVYLKEAYGELAGFLYGWSYFLVINTGGIAALSVAFAAYFGYFVALPPAGLKIVAIVGIFIVTIINVLGVKAGGVFSDVFTVLKLAGIFGLIVVGIGWGTSETTGFTAPLGDLPDGLGSALAVAMVGVLWSYGGWQHASFLAGEAKEAQRTVPLAMIFGAIAVTLIYVLTNFAYMFLLTPAQIADSSRVAADAIGMILGPIGASVIALTIFISTFGTTGIYTLTAPRIYYAMASDGVFFPKVAEVHSQFHTPVFAILLQSVWAIVLVLFWGTFEDLISYVVFTDWIFFALAAASVFVVRKRSATGAYKTPGYPLTPLFFVGMSVWFVSNTLVERPAQAWAGLILLALGGLVYYFWMKKKNQKKSSSSATQKAD